MLILATIRPPGAAMHPAAITDALLPLAAGAALGALLPACRQPLRNATPVLVAGLSFGLGSGLDLRHAGPQLLSGALLGAGAALISGGLVATGWRLLLRQPPAVGWAAAGCTVSMPLVPALIATADPSWARLVPAATGQLDVALVTSTLAAAALTAAVAHRAARNRAGQPGRPPRGHVIPHQQHTTAA
jgi:2-keto-3-deoxygluconate permease